MAFPKYATMEYPRYPFNLKTLYNFQDFFLAVLDNSSDLQMLAWHSNNIVTFIYHTFQFTVSKDFQQ